MGAKQSELIVALDVENFMEARYLIEQLSGSVDIFKVGSQLFTAVGPMAVRFIQAKGKRVFLDLKFYDIPNTVANAVRAAVGLSAPVQDAPGQRERPADETSLFMYTLHVEGGIDMMKAAVEAGVKRAEELKVKRPLAVGITVLTSEAKKDNMRAVVLERALMAEKAGLDGVVASSEEAAMIRKELGKDFIIVTPGIRPKGASDDDQARITTPADAVANGSDFLVVGRPIVKAKNPLLATKSILEEIKGVKRK